jgi:circadian clock protein KaiC
MGAPMSDKVHRRVGTGIPGLDDEVLHGGLIPGRVYLVDGNPGAGKTTLSLQFLLEGVR